MTSSNPYRVFVSHGKGDAYLVKKLLVPLGEQSGAAVFVDNAAIDYGSDFRERIITELQACDELLVFLTASSIQRPWVHAEIGAAMILKKRIVAVLYGPRMRELQSLGILSLLGTTRTSELGDEFERDYVVQLRGRVEAHSNG